jgi:hypothetical protein
VRSTASLAKRTAGTRAGRPLPLATSLARFVGSEGYDLVQLRADLVRFRFLLGGDDGHLLFGEDDG